jgi:hypothetical protein
MAVSNETNAWQHARALAAQVQEQPSTLTSDFVKALIILDTFSSGVPSERLQNPQALILTIFSFLFLSCVSHNVSCFLCTKGPFSV